MLKELLNPLVALHSQSEKSSSSSSDQNGDALHSKNDMQEQIGVPEPQDLGVVGRGKGRISVTSKRPASEITDSNIGDLPGKDFMCPK